MDEGDQGEDDGTCDARGGQCGDHRAPFQAVGSSYPQVGLIAHLLLLLFPRSPAERLRIK